jgi:hypothetical protein
LTPTYTKQGKRVFIKDMAYYLFLPDGKAPVIAASLTGDAPSLTADASGTNGTNGANGVKDDRNPTVMPSETLKKFDFAFLIRHPRRAIPSYFRCTVSPLVEMTGFDDFMPNEAGYDELRRLFDYLRAEGLIGPGQAGQKRKEGSGINITVVDADDLLDQPAEMIEAFCKEVGLEYTPEMLRWDDEENQRYATQAFEKWHGFHEDALGSTYLRPRTKKQVDFLP